MTPDSPDSPASTPSPSSPSPRKDTESVFGSDSGLGAAPPPEEVSDGSSIFDLRPRKTPTSFSDAGPNLLQGSTEFGAAPESEPESPLSEVPPADPVPVAAQAAEPPLEPILDLGSDVVPSEQVEFAPSAETSLEAAAPATSDMLAADSATAVSEMSAALSDIVEQIESVTGEPSAAVDTPLWDETAPLAEPAAFPETMAEQSGTPPEDIPDEESDGGFLVGQGTAASEGAVSFAETFAEAPAVAPTTDEPIAPAVSDEAAPGDPISAIVPEDENADPLAALGGLTAGAALASPWATDDSPVATTTTSSPRPAAPAPPQRDPLKLLLISYGLLATVVAGILWKRLSERTYREQTLESLPDVLIRKPGQIGTFDPATVLPPGHTLKLGEARRFGNLEVEAFKITRGMVSFQHPIGDQWAPAPEGPVTKLWLRFRNVSQDQAFPPLDKYLVFTKNNRPGQEEPATNNVLTRAVDRHPFAYVLTHAPSDKSVVKGQDLDVDLPPGGMLETFIPTTADVQMPEGDLLWRVHFRKGIARSGGGVTTLIEIAFNAKDVSEDG